MSFATMYRFWSRCSATWSDGSSGRRSAEVRPCSRRPARPARAARPTRRMPRWLPRPGASRHPEALPGGGRAKRPKALKADRARCAKAPGAGHVERANAPVAHRGNRPDALAVRGAAIVVSLILVLLAAPQAGHALDAREIFEAAESSIFPEKSEMTFEMETTRPGRRDSRLVFETLYRRGTGSFMEITEPSRSRGTRFLQLDSDLWMYDPRSGGGPVRLSPRDSFQGSVFSNRDLTDQQFSHHYDPEIAGEETLDHPWEGEVDAIVLEAPADHPDAAYGSVTMWVRATDRLPLRIDYESRGGLPFKQMTIGEFEERAGTLRPTRMEMRALDEEDAVSTVRILSLEVPDSIPDRYFTQRALTR